MKLEFLRRFGVLNPARHIDGPAAHALGISDGDKQLLLQAVRQLQIAPELLHSVATNYLRSLPAPNDEVVRELVEFIETTPDFEDEMFGATRDALVFANLAGALYPEAFRCSLATLSPLRWTELSKMRRKLFLIGFDVLFESPSLTAEDKVRLPVARSNAEAFLHTCA